MQRLDGIIERCLETHKAKTTARNDVARAVGDAGAGLTPDPDHAKLAQGSVDA